VESVEFIESVVFIEFVESVELGWFASSLFRSAKRAITTAGKWLKSDDGEEFGGGGEDSS
jgi:hypothetical protein